MPRTSAVDRPDFQAWRAYRVLVDAEAASHQMADFQFHPEGRSQFGVWIHGGPTAGVRIGAVRFWSMEYADPTTGRVRRRREYEAIADAALPNGRITLDMPTVGGFRDRQAAAALLYGRWIERRARHRELEAAVNAPALLPG